MLAYTPLPHLLGAYQPAFREEIVFRNQFFELLLHPRAFHIDHLPGHITGSAWVVNPPRTKVLLHHHRKLNKWLQPGGHADGNENVLKVAWRELEEETGLRNVKLLVSGIFDLDIHTIPARNDFHEHLHYDVRFLFEAGEGDNITVSEESFDVRWIAIDELNSLTENISIHRMGAKTLKIQTREGPDAFLL